MMQATISTVLANTSFVFTGNHAVAAIAAVRAHKMIDAMGVPAGAPSGTPATRFQIPYSSVLILQYMTTQSEETVEDANCKVRTPETKPEGLIIIGGAYLINTNITVTLGDTSINGTYGDLTFTDGVANAAISTGQTITAEGLPDGTAYTISGVQAETGSLTGTTPATVTITRQSQ